MRRGELRREHLVIGGLIAAAVLIARQRSSMTGQYSNVAIGTGPSYWQRAAQSPPVLGGAGNTLYGARDDPYGIYRAIPPSAINGMLPAVTQDAFAAFPRSAALQGG